MEFTEANEKIHSVETQWHYSIMTKYGYLAETRTGKGFVRQYRYIHPATGKVMIVATGANSDYWLDKGTGAVGFWSDLEDRLKKVEGEAKCLKE